MYDVFNLTEAKEGVEKDPCSQIWVLQTAEFLSLVVENIFSAKADFPDMMFSL